MKVFVFSVSISIVLSVCGLVCSQQFDKCNIKDQSSYSNILDTLNGRVKGECYNIKVSHPNGTKMSANVMNWLSVPYAEPPINENRFQNPVPKKPWNNVIDGTIWPKACINRFSANGSEDCLYLNIFVKHDTYINRNRTLVPILFFIHGGGLVSGETAVDYYESSTLAAYGDIVVITVQYRLAAFGFLHLTDSLAKGNQGILDQHLALKWVYENANKFGGDHTRITICGESAGAISVGFHLLYEKSWPYFRNAIMESGGPNMKTFAMLSSEEANKRSTDLFAYLGCNSSYGTPNEILKCAQKLDANLILNASFDYLRKKIFPIENRSLLTGTHFPPIINNDTFSETVSQIIEKKKFKKCKIISGFNSGEFGATIASNSLTDLGPDPSKWEQNAKLMNSTTFLKVLDEFFYYHPKHPLIKSKDLVNNIIKEYLPNGDLQSSVGYFKYLQNIIEDFLFICPSYEISEAFSKSGLEAYVYLYDHWISSSIYPKFLGAVHTDELPMLFAETLSNKKPPIISANHWSSAFHNYSSREQKFNQDFLNYWLNFIKYDNPSYELSNGLTKWNPFFENYNSEKNKQSQYLILMPDAIRMKAGFHTDKCGFWNYTKLSVNSDAASIFKAVFTKPLFIFFIFFRILF
jgi:carboxylesterase type B